VRATAALAAGARVGVRFRLPRSSRDIEATARVVWSRTAQAALGLQFETVAAADQQAIDEVADKLQAIIAEHGPRAVATFSGMPVTRVGRADPGGRVPSGWDDVTIAGSNLDCNKARLLLMATMLKLGRLPKARDPRNPTRAERAATVARVAQFQEIFENH